MKTEDVVSFLKAKGGYSPAANSLALLGMQLSFDAVSRTELFHARR